MTITVYTQPSCSQCTLTKNWLKRRDINYRVIDLTESPADLAAIKALGYMSAPVVIINDDGDMGNEKHWYGFRPDLLTEFAGKAVA